MPRMQLLLSFVCVCVCVSQVWISLAQFEMSVTSGEGDDDAGDGSHVRRCRDVYAEANRKLKETEEKEERLMLLETWREFESEHGDARSLESVDKLMPNKVKKRRKIQTDDGVSADVTRHLTPVILCCAMRIDGLSCFVFSRTWVGRSTTTTSSPTTPKCSRT